MDGHAGSGPTRAITLATRSSSRGESIPFSTASRAAAIMPHPTASP